MALPLYAATLFLSAFILFLVQPIVGKILLPKLGGTPQVWNTCMVFFQMVLLAGYAYTHNATTRLTLRQQLIMHGILLILPLIILLPFPFSLGGEFVDGNSGAITNVSKTTPIEITAPGHKFQTDMRVRIAGVEMLKSDGKPDPHPAINGNWTITVIDSDKFSLNYSVESGSYVEKTGTFVGGTPNPHSLWGFVPDLGTNPLLSTFIVLFSYIALPFVVVATTAPLLQKWFVATGHPASKDPYFLYGASNLGSMLSLILYPLIIEPELKLSQQGWTYTFGYVLLAGFVLACAAMVWNSKEALAQPKHPTPHAPTPAPAVAADTSETGIAAGAPAPAAAPAATAIKSGPPRGPKGAPDKHHGDAPINIASDEMTFARQFRWVALAAIPSSLMLGITTHITTDLSPMPLFWLVPLILYLGSFILVFMRWPFNWLEKAHVYFLYGQPIAVALMIMVDVLHLTGDTSFLVFAIFCHVLGFFATTMVCHGELAKDRPSTKHLTKFYLWMSVGGMVGGMFNGLVAPIIFWKLWELPLAIFAAVLVRPKMFDTGLLDNFLANMFEGKAEVAAPKPGQKGKPAPVIARSSSEANDSLVRTLDFAWPIAILVLTVGLLLILPPTAQDNSKAEAARAQRNMVIDFALPLLLACLCMARPIRVGLGFGAVLLVFNIFQAQGDRSIYAVRTYFGAMSIKEYDTSRSIGAGKREAFKYRQLIHGHIDHGMNFLIPKDRKDRQDPLRDLSRLATTYYHREGPAGRVMEKYNWFPDAANANTYWADARMPANLVTAALADFGSGSSTVPMTALVSAWSEPPFATVGLGTGTMSSYGRCYQHVHFYEIDNEVRLFSLAVPTRELFGDYEKDVPVYKNYVKMRDASGQTTYFNYLEQAVERGSSVQVLMGDARLRMALPYKNHYQTFRKGEPDNGGGPMNFYHMMVVDAFSSDAIPAHLLTKEAFLMYFDRLAPEGILCVHTSNRFVDLPKVVAAIAGDLKFAARRGHDNDTDREEGHYTSEWVMVARKDEHLKALLEDTTFLDRYNKRMTAKLKPGEVLDPYWETPRINTRYLWTDDYYNLLSVVRFRPRRKDD